MTTYTEALDRMVSVFKTVWGGSAVSTVLGYTPGAEYEGVADDNFAALDLIWARFVVRNALEQQSTLGAAGAPGEHEYEGAGLVSVEIFLPKSVNTSLAKGRKIAMLVRDAFRKAGGTVWFRNVTVKELDAEPKWGRIDVIIEYNFTEIV